MGTHLYNSFHSLERILEGNQELSKEVLKKFGGHVEFNGCNSIVTLRSTQVHLSVILFYKVTLLI